MPAKRAKGQKQAKASDDEDAHAKGGGRADLQPTTTEEDADFIYALQLSLEEPKREQARIHTNETYSQDLLNLVSRLYDDAASSDLLVQLQGKEQVRCHRLLLCSWSDVWAAALQDKDQNTLDLSIYDADTVRRCLQYCYTGRLALTDDLVQAHRFALCYHLQGLQSFCEAVMRQELSVKNCVTLYSYLFASNIPGLSVLREDAKKMLCTHFAAASLETSFCTLSGDTLCEILAWQIIEVSEDDILKACCRWISHNKASVALQVQERLLQLVRFSQLSPKALLEFKSHELMTQSTVVAQHYMLGVEWRMTEHAGPDRAALQTQLKRGKNNAVFEPRGPVFKFTISIASQILDEAMKKQLAAMLGQSASATLFKDPRRQPLGLSPPVATRPSFPFLYVIRDSEGHVFGACCLTETSGFLFSLKQVGSQRVVKLLLAGARCSFSQRYVQWPPIWFLSVGTGLVSSMSFQPLLRQPGDSTTADDPQIRLAPGYEAVGTRTLHGKFGPFVPSMVEVFQLALSATGQHSSTARSVWGYSPNSDDDDNDND